MFRANEESERLRIEAFKYLLSNGSSTWREDDRSNPTRSEHALTVLSNALGPFIIDYPEWHPINALGRDKTRRNSHDVQTTPRFPRLDHTRYLANGIITCPYGSTDELIAAVNGSYGELMRYLYDSEEARFNDLAGWLRMASGSIELHASYITDELIESFEYGHFDYDGSDTREDDSDLIPIYNKNAKPVLIWWNWNKHDREPDGTIPPAIAVPLMLSRTLADLSYADRSESWDSMRPLLLGSPHGSRSSLLLSQLTVKQLRTMFNGLMDSGAYGPPKSR
ncbi:hypothetical protein [Phytobacter diazotrophicus]|uniref:hypothetical protein n=1 Tax=Phytobacter diazotrophicus TaxID=395631 RepID=UPI0030765AAD